MRFHRSLIVATGVLALAACASHTPAPRPVAGSAGSLGLTALEAPSCGARIFVAMGFNQNYPQQENMRIPAGDLFLNGEPVDTVSKNPEITVLDVPAGRTTLTWVPTRFDAVSRARTQQNKLTLTLADRQTAYVVLDLYDDTPPVTGFFATAPAAEIRTEVARSDANTFIGKRVVFHHALEKLCMPAPVMAENAPAPPPPSVKPVTPPSPPVVAPEPKPAPPPKIEPPKVEPKVEPKPAPQVAVAPPPPPPPVQSKPEPAPAPKIAPVAPLSPPAAAPPPPATAVETPPQIAALPPPAVQPNAAPAFTPAGPYYYYTVSARDGAPAYETARAEGKPVYTFKDATQLNVVAISTDRRWLRVLTPERQTVYVSTTTVTMGARGR